MHPAFEEVIQAHVAIEQWLNGTAPQEALAPLLARFGPAFSMIALDGQRLSRPAVAAFFTQARGTRPGLNIEIDELTDIHHERGAWVVGYREIHRYPDGREIARRATAVFDTPTPNGLAWRHLHETPLA